MRYVRPNGIEYYDAEQPIFEDDIEIDSWPPEDGKLHRYDFDTEAWVEREPTEDEQRQDIEARNRSYRQYLNETDWYVIREQEMGKPMPEDVRHARQAAREAIVD